jgi:hypothetical protein
VVVAGVGDRHDVGIGELATVIGLSGKPEWNPSDPCRYGSTTMRVPASVVMT